jgi:predicted lipoprotein with Yx(FWY)xxD motif
MGGETVAVSDMGGAGTVLVDSRGNALYSPEQEANGKILCTGSCESEWMPLTASGSSKPTGSADVTGKVGTIKRPDGTEQVTVDGAPLYTFAEDGGPGQVTGDGFADQFDGNNFTWHVVRADGSTSDSSQAGSTTTGSGGGYGGY